MPGSNDFLQFNPNKNNIMSQADYNGAGQRMDGVNGIANSKLHNKIFYQTSMMGTMIGEFIKASGGIAQDQDIVALMEAFRDAIVLNLTPATETVQGVARIATNTEMVVGTSDTTIVTPKKLKDNINSFVPDSTTTVKGKIRIATDAEATAGTLTTVAITPKQLKDNVPDSVPQATEAMIGGGKLATTAEATAGTNDLHIMTPLKTKQAIDNSLPDLSLYAKINSPKFTGQPENTTPTTVYTESRITNTWIGTVDPSNAQGINGDVWIKI